MKNKELIKSSLHKLVEDNIPFSVLYKILQGECTDIYTNHQSFIICYSCYPYPIWVWCKDINNKSDVEIIAKYLKENYLTKGKYNIILSHDLLESLQELDDTYKNLSLKMELLSYKLEELNQIDRLAKGKMRVATIEDLAIMAEIKKAAYFEMEGFEFSLEECKNKALEQINKGDLYVWVDQNDEIRAVASKRVDGKYASVGSVYTFPKYRRNGYATAIVHALSKRLLEDHLTPILYTDGGYAASNECYKKIGFKLVGRLSNVENNIESLKPISD